MDGAQVYTSPQYEYHQHQYEDSYRTPTLNTTQNKLRRKRSMHRSTSRASKQRRDLINTEIARLRDLLPLPGTVKTRLSYLHVMSLACVYIRKGNFFHKQGEFVLFVCIFVCLQQGVYCTHIVRGCGSLKKIVWGGYPLKTSSILTYLQHAFRSFRLFFSISVLIPLSLSPLPNLFSFSCRYFFMFFGWCDRTPLGIAW